MLPRDSYSNYAKVVGMLFRTQVVVPANGSVSGGDFICQIGAHVQGS